MTTDTLLLKLEGLHTVETIAKELSITRQSALNLVSRLKKEGYITVSGGGKQKRLYKLTTRKQRPRALGMFDILNKYSPMKLQPWYDHQVHGRYGVEEALIDALQTQSFRAILASLRLFNHITDWPKLYKLAKQKDCWNKVGALYDVARLFFKVKKIPELYKKEKKYKAKKSAKMQFLIRDYTTKEEKLIPIGRRWNVYIPFRIGDIKKLEI